jgi:DNA-binding response OmpR family regulator
MLIQFHIIFQFWVGLVLQTWGVVYTMEFNFPNPVRRMEDYIGRKDSLDEVCRNLMQQTPASILVIGEYRTGKTSFQNVSLLQADGMAQNKIIRLDIRLHPAEYFFDRFVRELFQELCSKVGKPLEETILFNPAGSIMPISNSLLLKEIRDLTSRISDALFVLCIDDLDLILSAKEITSDLSVDIYKVIGLLNALSEKTGELRVVVYVTMQQSPEQFQIQSFGSPALLQSSSWIELRNLTAPESRKFIDHFLPGEITPQAFQTLMDLSGGNPFLIKLILKWFRDNWKAGISPLTPEEMYAAIPAILDSPQARLFMTTLLNELLSSRQRELLHTIHARGGMMEADVVASLEREYQQEAEHLLRSGYMGCRQDGSWVIGMGLISGWIQSHRGYTGSLHTRILELDQLIIDRKTRNVSCRGREIRVTDQEYLFLELLCQKRNELVTREDITNKLWPEDRRGVENSAIDQIVSRIRAKLGEDDPHKYIQTVHGKGFILRNCRFDASDM